MSASRKSDWTAIFFLFLLVGAMLIAFTTSSAKAQQPPLREGCRALSKLHCQTGIHID
jgi:hypothetical protein